MNILRFDRATFAIVQRWFNAVTEKYQKPQYEYGNIWNMDELDFGIREL